jgi:hypothetical protein
MKPDQPFHLREHTALWIAVGAALILSVLLLLQSCWPEPPAQDPPLTVQEPGTGAVPFALPTPADADISDFTAVYAEDVQTSDDVIVGDDLEVQGGAAAIYGTTPALTVGDAGAEDTKIVFDGNAQDFYLGLDDSADDLLLGLGSAVGTTGIIHLDASQDVGLGAASAGAKLDVTGNVLVDGGADEAQITVQGYTTQTNSLAVFEQSDGTDVVTVSNDGTVAAVDVTVSDDLTVTDDINVGGGDLLVESTAFTRTAPITITGVLTNVRLLYYQVP